jgi:ABC-2 type transport system permease protein
MLHALSLYRRLILIHIRSQMQYRTAFLFDVLATGLITLLGFATLALVLQRFGSVGGWRLAEVAFLYGMIELSYGTMDMVFTGFDPDRFSPAVRFGRFDQLLLRPVNLTLQVLGSDFILRRVGRILQGGAVLGLALYWLEVDWTVGKLLYLPAIFIGLVAFFGGLSIFGAALTFWTIERIEAVHILTSGGAEMMSYPMHIYPGWLKGFFTYILPAIFLLYYPALYFMDKPSPLAFPFPPQLLPLLAGLVVLGAGLGFWNYGLRFYQSTGS